MLFCTYWWLMFYMYHVTEWIKFDWRSDWHLYRQLTPRSYKYTSSECRWGISVLGIIFLSVCVYGCACMGACMVVSALLTLLNTKKHVIALFGQRKITHTGSFICCFFFSFPYTFTFSCLYLSVGCSSVCLSVCLYIKLCVCLSMCLCVCLCVCLSICLYVLCI